MLTTLLLFTTLLATAHAGAPTTDDGGGGNSGIYYDDAGNYIVGTTPPSPEWNDVSQLSATLPDESEFEVVGQGECRREVGGLKPGPYLRMWISSNADPRDTSRVFGNNIQDLYEKHAMGWKVAEQFCLNQPLCKGFDTVAPYGPPGYYEWGTDMAGYSMVYFAIPRGLSDAQFIEKVPFSGTVYPNIHMMFVKGTSDVFIHGPDGNPMQIDWEVADPPEDTRSDDSYIGGTDFAGQGVAKVCYRKKELPCDSLRDQYQELPFECCDH